MKPHLVLWLSLFYIAGCSQNRSTVPATGKVTLNGRTVSNANVTFISETSGPAAFAVTDQDGQFEMLTGLELGVKPGKYKVLIQKDTSADLIIPEGVGRPDYMKQHNLLPKPIVPVHYGNLTTSPLRADVGTQTLNHFEFTLE